jgi:metallo-beta-lactamase family protein
MYLSDPKNTIIFLGYQAAGTLGRKIEEGIKKVKIDDEEISVLAEVKKISGYSSHKDSDSLVDFVANSGANLKEVFVVMGEPKSSSFLAERIKDELGIKALCPEKEKTYKLF